MSDTDGDWSAPETEVLDRVGAILDGDGRGVLATIVAVEGSAYRRPGAKMVIPEGGGGVGHVTAGCLEDEVERLAAEVLAADAPRIETYDLRPEGDDDVWGLGVGCNGIIDVLLEPIDESLRPLVEAARASRPIGVATVTGVADGDTPVPVGSRAYYLPGGGSGSGPASVSDRDRGRDQGHDSDRDRDADGDPDGDGTDPADPTLTPVEADQRRRFPASLSARIGRTVAKLTATGRSDAVAIEGTTVFVDGVVPPAEVLVVGSGNDVRPIVRVARRAGFRVTVAGFRGASATPDRFPAADEVVATSPTTLTETVDVGSDTHVVVATHNFLDDCLAVEELLATDAPYVGLMGPRERFEEMLGEIRADGGELPAGALERLYTPVGLDLGGGTPYQIALSVVGEVLAVSNDRTPKHLRDREGRIHDRIDPSPSTSDD
jgi:xanthine dehydrogenase accessory factor